MIKVITILILIGISMLFIFSSNAKKNEAVSHYEFADIISELAENDNFGEYIRVKKHGSFTVETTKRRIRCERCFDTYKVTIINGDSIVPINNLEVSRKKDLVFLLETLTK